jgi:hypothetical protein
MMFVPGSSYEPVLVLPTVTAVYVVLPVVSFPNGDVALVGMLKNDASITVKIRKDIANEPFLICLFSKG